MDLSGEKFVVLIQAPCCRLFSQCSRLFLFCFMSEFSTFKVKGWWWTRDIPKYLRLLMSVDFSWDFSTKPSNDSFNSVTTFNANLNRSSSENDFPGQILAPVWNGIHRLFCLNWSFSSMNRSGLKSWGSFQYLVLL